MRIKNIRIENFKSIEALDLPFNAFNVVVGQNNHGKTNFFDAVKWFFNGFDRSVLKDDLLFAESPVESEIVVEVRFEGLQNGVASMTNEGKKKALEKIFEGVDEITIRRSTEFDSGKKRQLKNPEGDHWENPMGVDSAWNDFLPTLEYVHTKVSLDDIGNFKSKAPIAEMLSGVLSSIVENDDKYRELRGNFEELFGHEDSGVRTKLNELGTKVEVYLKKQFPDDTSIKFNVEIPEFTDLLKKFSTEVNDGVATSVEDKGDGMQRAVMLSIIQAYADYRKENALAKKFVFLIDEAELHLHPSAQRALKKALLEIATGEDQVFVNTHSSVLVTDVVPEQGIYKAEKENKRTVLIPINNRDTKMDVIFELLGGSPADLLLPRNFIIVEGQSEYEFINRVKALYGEKYAGIKVLFARGDMERTREVFHAIHEAYRPLFVEKGIYQKRVVVLCDKPNSDNQKHYDSFLEAHPWIKEGEQLHCLPVDALEKYYPGEYKLDDDGIKGIEEKEGKVNYARRVVTGVSKEQFDREMPIIKLALDKANEKAFEALATSAEIETRPVFDAEHLG